MKNLSPPNQKPYQLIIPIVVAVLSLAGLICSGIFAAQSLSGTSSRPGSFQPDANNISAPPDDVPTDSQNQQPNQPQQNPTPPDDMNTENSDPKPSDRDDFHKDFMNQPNISASYVILISFCASLFCFSICFLIYSLRRRNFFKNRDKLTIYLLTSILCSIILSASTVAILNATNTDHTQFAESTAEKDDVELDLSHIANSNTIDLNNYDSELTISDGGTYTISGKSAYPLIINAPEKSVELILDNVEISTTNTAAIIGLDASKITITTAADSVNDLSDSGNSSYDGCIFSNAELIFNGSGTLNVKGQQSEGEGIATETNDITINSGTINIESEDDGLNAGGDGGTITINGGKIYINANGDGIDSNQNVIINGGTIFTIGSDTGGDAGIDTDDGYTINGGTVIALGSDMLEKPLATSKQNFLTYSLTSSIAKNTIVTIMTDNSEIVSFSAPKSFRTIVVSTSKIDSNKTYSVYTGGTHSGTLESGIYTDGKYTKGEKLL